MIRIIITAAILSAVALIATYVLRGIGDVLEQEASREREMSAWH